MNATCRYCSRGINRIAGRWVDPEATGDDAIWRETCDAHDTFVAEHEPVTGESLGTVGQAADALGVDAAGVFEMYARGQLEMTRDRDSEPWTVWRVVPS